MTFREVKYLAAGIILVSLVMTNVIIPSILDDLPKDRITAISKPVPVDTASVPEPVRVLSPAEAAARAAARRAHADRVLAENGELPEQRKSDDSAGHEVKCVAGCD